MKLLDMDSETAVGAEPKVFRQRASTFNLCVTLNAGKLKIELEDFCDWAIYQNQYSEDDIGKQIHKKMELEDIFLSFSGSLPEGENKQESLKEYTYGEVVKNGEVLCYKVEKEGFVTTYMNYFDRRTKNQVIYESKLILNKMKNLDKSEIFLRQSSLEKEKLIEKFNSELAEVNKQKYDLVKKITFLEQQNAKTKAEVLSQKEEIIKINEVLGFYKMKMALINESMDKFSNAQAENQIEVISLRKEIKNTKSSLQEQSTQYLNSIRQQMLRLVELFESQRLQSLSELNKLNNQLLEIRTKILPFSITGLTQPNSKHFQITKNQLTYIGQNGKCTHFIFNEIVPTSSIYSFKIKVVKSPSAWVMVGILDTEKQMEMRYSYSSNNALCYYSGGEKYPSGIIEGGGFQQGNIVETQVDLPNKTIKWLVDGVIKATLTHKLLADRFVTFRPFVQVYYKDDVVEWLME